MWYLTNASTTRFGASRLRLEQSDATSAASIAVDGSGGVDGGLRVTLYTCDTSGNLTQVAQGDDYGGDVVVGSTATIPAGGGVVVEVYLWASGDWQSGEETYRFFSPAQTGKVIPAGTYSCAGLSWSSDQPDDDDIEVTFNWGAAASHMPDGIITTASGTQYPVSAVASVALSAFSSSPVITRKSSTVATVALSALSSHVFSSRPTIGGMTDATDTSVTLDIAQGILPIGATDRFYVSRSGWIGVNPLTCLFDDDFEPETADATLMTGEHTSITFEDLLPGRRYMVMAWRHFADESKLHWNLGEYWQASSARTTMSIYESLSPAVAFGDETAAYTPDWSDAGHVWEDEAGGIIPVGFLGLSPDFCDDAEGFIFAHYPGSTPSAVYYIPSTGIGGVMAQGYDISETDLVVEQDWMVPWPPSYGEYDPDDGNGYDLATVGCLYVSESSYQSWFVDDITHLPFPGSSIPEIDTVYAIKLVCHPDSSVERWVDGVHLDTTSLYRGDVFGAPVRFWIGSGYETARRNLRLTGVPWLYSCADAMGWEFWEGSGNGFAAIQAGESTGVLGGLTQPAALGAWGGASPIFVCATGRTWRKVDYAPEVATGPITVSVVDADTSEVYATATYTSGSMSKQSFDIANVPKSARLQIVVEGTGTSAGGTATSTRMGYVAVGDREYGTAPVSAVATVALSATGSNVRIIGASALAAVSLQATAAVSLLQRTAATASVALTASVASVASHAASALASVALTASVARAASHAVASVASVALTGLASNVAAHVAATTVAVVTMSATASHMGVSTATATASVALSAVTALSAAHRALGVASVGLTALVSEAALTGTVVISALATIALSAIASRAVSGSRGAMASVALVATASRVARFSETLLAVVMLTAIAGWRRRVPEVYRRHMSGASLGTVALDGSSDSTRILDGSSANMDGGG